MADVALMSRFHWHRVFQAITGETCAEAVRRIRLFLAASWLLNCEEPIAQIAARAGYPNTNSFAREFNQRFGVSPAAFRKAGRPGLPREITTSGSFTMFTVETKTVPLRRLAATQHEGAYTGIGSIFNDLADTATTKNLWPKVQGMVGVYYDNPNVVDESELRSHAGLLMADKEDIPANLEEVVLNSGEYAVLSYRGAYSAIKVAYDFLYGDWLPKSGREPADAPSYEMYLNSPADTAEADLLTEIFLPLQK